MSYIKKIKIVFIPMSGLEFNFRPFVHMEWAGKAETNERISIFDFERKKKVNLFLFPTILVFISIFDFEKKKMNLFLFLTIPVFNKIVALPYSFLFSRICLCFQNFWKKFNLHFLFPKTHPKTNNSLIFLLSHLLSSTKSFIKPPQPNHSLNLIVLQ